MNSKTISGNLSALAAAAILAGAGLGLLPTVASAADPNDGIPRKTVHFGDLDLSTQAGAAILYRRIHAAAVEVCGSVDPMDLALAHIAKECEDHATSQAVATIGNPMLTQVYLEKSGHKVTRDTEVAGR